MNCDVKEMREPGTQHLQCNMLGHRLSPTCGSRDELRQHGVYAMLGSGRDLKLDRLDLEPSTMNRIFGSASSKKPKPTLQDAIASVSQILLHGGMYLS